MPVCGPAGGFGASDMGASSREVLFCVFVMRLRKSVASALVVVCTVAKERVLAQGAFTFERGFEDWDGLPRRAGALLAMTVEGGAD